MARPKRKRQRPGVPLGKIPHKKRHVHSNDFGILLSPAPKNGERYSVLSKKAFRRPLKDKKFEKDQESISFSIGRDPEQSNFPVPFYKAGGVSVMPSRVNGTLTASLTHDQHGAWLRNLQYMNIGRGTAVFELPKKLRTPKQILKSISEARPHPENPILVPGVAGKGMVKIRPNRTVLVFGVHPDTIENQNLRASEYTDIHGLKRQGFKDEHGHLYPFMVVTAPRRPDSSEEKKK